MQSPHVGRTQAPFRMGAQGAAGKARLRLIERRESDLDLLMAGLRVPHIAEAMTTSVAADRRAIAQTLTERRLDDSGSEKLPQPVEKAGLRTGNGARFERTCSCAPGASSTGRGTRRARRLWRYGRPENLPQHLDKVESAPGLRCGRSRSPESMGTRQSSGRASCRAASLRPPARSPSGPYSSPRVAQGRS